MNWSDVQELRRKVKRVQRSFSVDPRRWPDPAETAIRLVKLLKGNKVSTVLDVGANVGTYALDLRKNGFRGTMLSFEPVLEQFQRLTERSANDSLWTPVHAALGAANTEVTINVAANHGASSSILPMLEQHIKSAPAAAYVREETVLQRRLDDICPTLNIHSSEPLFAKLDVQGYEWAVLEGAAGILDQIVGIQIEMSLVPLYEGGGLYQETLDWMDDHGYELHILIPGFWDRATGRQLQVDGVFFRH